MGSEPSEAVWWVSVWPKLASVLFRYFSGVADAFVVCGPVIFSLGRRGASAAPRPWWASAAPPPCRSSLQLLNPIICASSNLFTKGKIPPLSVEVF